jgi:hypothetical protein
MPFLIAKVRICAAGHILTCPYKIKKILFKVDDPVGHAA